MSLDLPNPAPNPKIKLVVGTPTDPVTEIEYAFDTYPRIRYQLQFSSDGFRTWTDALDIIGDGTRKSYVRQIDKTKSSEAPRLLQHAPEGSEPLNLIAYSDWSGRSVLLEWNVVGVMAAGRFKILRDGNEIAIVPFSATNFVDSHPTPGAHVYSVGLYN